MADTKISNLSAASTLGAVDILPVVQSGVTKKATMTQMWANSIPVALTSAYTLIGNGSNIAAGVAVSGDATITNAGAVTVAKTVITDDAATAVAVYPVWAASASGSVAHKVTSAKLNFVPATGVLNVPSLNVTGAVFQLTIGGANALWLENVLNNTFGGVSSGPDTVTFGGGTGNTGFGNKALDNVSAGSYNTGFGFAALTAVTGGLYNVAVGDGTLMGVLGGSNNTAYGSGAGWAVTTGSNNTLIGADVAGTLTTGSGNVIIGTSAALDVAAVGTSNTLNIGGAIIGSGLGGTVALEFPAATIVRPIASKSKLGTLAASTFGWTDIPSNVNIRGSGSDDPAWSVYRNGLYAYAFSASLNKETHHRFHIGHDYAQGTVVYPHVHWTPNTTDTGVIRWGFEYSVAKSFQQGAGSTFGATTTVYVEQNVATNSQYQHFTAEVAIGDAIPATLLEAASIIMCRCFRDASHVNDTFTGVAFLISVDLHVQVERNSTLNKAPNFYA